MKVYYDFVSFIKYGPIKEAVIFILPIALTIFILGSVWIYLHSKLTTEPRSDG